MTDFASTKVSLDGVPATTGIAAGAASGGLLTVTISGVATQVLANRDITFAAGDRVLVQRVGASWFALARVDLAATNDQPDNQPVPPPKPTTTTGTKVFQPVETRSYRSLGWRTDTDDVYQGQFGGNGNHTGCAFYGSAPRSLAGATVTSASVRLQRPSRGGSASGQSLTLQLIDQATRPSGAPTRDASTSGPSLKWGQTDNSVSIPTSWAQDLVDGDAGGLGVFVSGGSPYVILAGRGTWASAWTLTINWKRTS